MSAAPLLSVERLRVTFGHLAAVEDVSFTVGDGERVAIVGESGSGKSVTAMSITGLINYQAGRIAPESKILYGGADITKMSDEEIRKIRGRQIGMVFQDHSGALNPVQRIGDQIGEALRVHDVVDSKAAARARALELLEQVGIDRASERLDAYPHELSGGMRQRVLIAMGLAPGPKLLIADEPTTALDALIQRQIVALLHDLTEALDLTLLMISHDLRLVSGFADRLYVMYGGRIVETGTAAQVFGAPQHQYTRALLDSLPSRDHRRGSSLKVIGGAPPSIAARPTGCPFHPRCRFNDKNLCESTMPPLESAGQRTHQFACYHPGDQTAAQPKEASRHLAPVPSADSAAEEAAPYLLEVVGLDHVYSSRGRKSTVVKAVDDVSFSIRRGESFGLVGESGSGKSTVARNVVRLIEPSAGRILFDGQDLMGLSRREMRTVRRRMQIVFQDPRSSLDPRIRVGELLAEPLRIYRLWGKPGHDKQRLGELMELVGLHERDLQKYPHEFSGGQLQRVAIARALTLSPDLVVCDEPVSSLDASVSAQIINLLSDLQAQLGLTYLFIGHDLSLVRYFCDHIAVMNKGQIVEAADSATLFSNPQHEYTKRLLDAQPPADPRTVARPAAATAP